MRYTELIESHDIDLNQLGQNITRMSLPKVNLIQGGLHSIKYVVPLLQDLRETAWDLKRLFKFYVSLAKYDGVKIIPSSGEFSQGVEGFMATVEELLHGMEARLKEDSEASSEENLRSTAGYELVSKVDAFITLLTKVLTEIQHELKNNQSLGSYRNALSKLFQNINTMRKLLKNMKTNIQRNFQT